MNKRIIILLAFIGLVLILYILFQNANFKKEKSISPSFNNQPQVIITTPTPLPTIYNQTEKEILKQENPTPTSEVPLSKGLTQYLNALKKFQDKESEIKIIREERYLEKDSRKKSRELEKITVVITHPSGKEDSFNALIDSQTGEVIKTFNLVKRDDIPDSPLERENGLSPKGGIQKKK